MFLDRNTRLDSEAMPPCRGGGLLFYEFLTLRKELNISPETYDFEERLVGPAARPIFLCH